MKKKLVLISSVLFLTGNLFFAQVSMTNRATADNFLTDVDYFIDVNHWNKVSPEKVFAFTDFYNNRLSLGAAKNFGSVYLAGYLSGNLPLINSISNETDTYTVKVTTHGYGGVAVPAELSSAAPTVVFPSLSSDTNAIEGTALLGMGNMGISLIFSYRPSFLEASVDYKDTTPDVTYKCNDPGFSFLGAHWGLNFDLNGKNFNTRTSVGFLFGNSNSELTDGNGITKYSSSDENLLVVIASAGYDFYKSDALTQKAIINMRVAQGFFAKDLVVTNGVVTSEQNKNSTSVTIYPAYRLKYDVNERLSFALSTTLSFAMNFESENNLAESSFVLTPDAGLGMRYELMPNKVFLNAGVDFSLPNLLKISNEERGASKEFSFFGGDLSCRVSAGLTFAITEKVSLDTVFDIYTPRTGASSVNGFLGSALGLQLSVKN